MQYHVSPSVPTFAECNFIFWLGQSNSEIVSLPYSLLLDFWVHYPTLPYSKLKNHYSLGPGHKRIFLKKVKVWVFSNWVGVDVTVPANPLPPHQPQLYMDTKTHERPTRQRAKSSYLSLGPCAHRTNYQRWRWHRSTLTLIYLPIANSASLNFGSIFTLSLYVRHATRHLIFPPQIWCFKLCTPYISWKLIKPITFPDPPNQPIH